MVRKIVRAGLPALLIALALAGCGAEGTQAGTEIYGPTPTPTAWWATVQDRPLYTGDRALTLEVPDDADELIAQLEPFEALETVTFTGGAVDTQTQDALRKARPDVEFRCDTEILGRVRPWNTVTLSLAGESLEKENLEELSSGLGYLSRVTAVDLSGCGIDEWTLRDFADGLDGIDVAYTVNLYGKEFSSLDEEIDLSGTPVSDGAAELEEALPLFPRLKKVVMCGCGPDSEEMDALDKRHDDVRFVWSVRFSIWTVRTDATNFICNRTYNRASLYSWQCRELRWCTDLIALDVGHKNITDLDFLYDLPRLQYLILAENPVRDLTPVASLGELKWLEIFWTRVEDLSPLLECTALRDLNVSYVYAKGDNAFGVLSGMTWLDRLWCCGSNMYGDQIDRLREALPDCEIFSEKYGESTGGTWRYHPHYYEMRDAFGMYYMNSGEDSSAQPNSKIPANLG